MQTGKRVVIVGGVAGGASCAARVRRLDESAEVTIFDRGPFVSFANCGLPYFVGDVIQDEKKLLVASPELFHNRFNITAVLNGTGWWCRLLKEQALGSENRDSEIEVCCFQL
jgi:NADPH-dependent 2,4-dienoyl-CoA reductase/sulfur reductase-like enzyme